MSPFGTTRPRWPPASWSAYWGSAAFRVRFLAAAALISPIGTQRDLPARTPIYHRAGTKRGRPSATWNYASAHAYGPAQRIDDAEWLRGVVRRLSENHEARAHAVADRGVA